MADTLLDAQRQMIQVFQDSLRQLRQVIGLGVQEFADCLGVTRQTVNNLETGRAIMSPMQYIAIAAVIDNRLRDDPGLFPIVAMILQTRDTSTPKVFDVIEERSLLRKWFSFFPWKPDFDTATQRALGPQGDFGFIADNYKIFLDDSILMCESFRQNAEPLLFALSTRKNSFIVPMSAVEALKSLSDSADEETCLVAKSSLEFLARLQRRGVLDLRGSVVDGSVSETICSVFEKFRQLYRLCLITQNLELVNKLRFLNGHCEQEGEGFNILLLRYDIYSKLQPWTPETKERMPDGGPDTENETNILNEAAAGWSQL